jgi:altronate dehydratase large subunit
MNVSAFLRPDGRVGVRNHVAVLPAVLCANEIARRIAEGVRGVGGAVALPHAGGCTCGEDVARTERVMAGLGSNPNVAGVLVLGLGCENCDSEKVAGEIAARCPWKPLERLVIQEVGVSRAIREGTEIVEKMVRRAARDKRTDVPLAGLTLAVECGGSDATSGLAANPALGVAVDALIAKGGSAMFSETTEAIGAAHLLARRAVSEDVAERIVQTIDRAEKRMVPLLAPGEHFLTSGNMQGGLTTLEEKSLGCICKTGSAAITEVVEYGHEPRARGLILVDGTGFDVPSMTGMVAAGAQIVAFTTGKGSPVGYPIAPVIKITGNPNTHARLEEIIDVNAASVTLGERDIREVGEEIFREVVAVADGKPTKAEVYGFRDFSIATLAGAYAGV